MAGWADRIKRELAANPKKTAIMTGLAVVLVVAWWIALSGDGKSRRPKPATPSTKVRAAAMRAPALPAVEPEAGTAARGAKRMEKARNPSGIPSFLGEPLPFEALGGNPFLRIPSAERKTPSPRRDPVESVESSAAEEARALDRLELQCTVKGRGGAYAVVSGEMLAPGDTYQGFRLDEVGEGYAVFSGRYVKRRIEVRPAAAAPLQERKKSGR